ncbi:Uncharacterized protein MJ0754 [hydrothermal vent metagenome]|uniref:Uncharacterized protein MJ0754 n=1 Tax=hydrothermal vent metagenome TaxID=652676 RepID=A0A1W1ECL2_9ZZZZ
MNKISRRNFFTNSIFALLSGVGLASCSSGDSPIENTALETESNDDIVSIDEQKDEIFYIYQEEKLARDAYITLGKLYPKENTFKSIQVSEQRHIDSARGLCEKYEIDISDVDEDSVGNFVIDVLQELYNTVIDEGRKGLLEALKMGELIEITDIDDLQRIIDNFYMPDDVITVYEKLKEGSYNHLESFQVAIKKA